MFGSSQQPQGQSKFGTLFGSTTAPPRGLFPNQQQPQQQQQQKSNLFGSSTAPAQQNASSSLFGSQQAQQQGQPSAQAALFAMSMQPPPTLPPGFQQQLEQQKQSLPALGKLGASTVGREKSVTEQMKVIFDKWNYQQPNSAFEYYFYNEVPPDEAPFYGPAQGEDETKWEEALAKKPGPGSIPVLARGYNAVYQRLLQQTQAVNMLQTRLHEINTSLVNLKQQHELSIESRVAEARRKHIVYTQRCLALATKIQILRNRGYAMDSSEEELKKKLLELEKKTFDPSVSGQQEELWARMSGIRAKAQALQAESERLGKNINNQEEILSEEDQKTVKKVLDDYDQQLTYLKKQLEEITKDYDEWTKTTKPSLTSATTGR